MANCISLKFFRYLANLSMFMSSRAASTSSSMQNGVGVVLSTANMRAMAVMVFSPPDIRLMFCSFLPGGWAIISIPASSGFSSLSSLSSACPPPNRDLKISSKFTTTLSKFSLNFDLMVFSISSIIALSWSMASVMSLR